MKTRFLANRRGAALIEFTIVFPVFILALIATFYMSIGMWEYDTLAYAVRQGARYAVVRGKGCSTANGNNPCATVGDIASVVAGQALGLPAGQLNVWLTTSSGAQTTCTPVKSCLSNATAWPPSSNNDNAPGSQITILAKYTFNYPLGSSYTLPASSTQLMQF